MKNISKSLSSFCWGARRSSSPSANWEDDDMMMPLLPYSKLRNSTTISKDDVENLLSEYTEKVLYDHPRLYNLLVDFFDSGRQVLEICNKYLKKSIEKAQHGECLIMKALHDFEEERRIYGEDSCFKKTLEDLKSFEEYSEDALFSQCFVHLFQNLEEKLATLWLNLKPNKKMKTKIYLTWSKQRNALKLEYHARDSIHWGTGLLLTQVEFLRGSVNNLNIHYESIAETAKITLETKSPVRLAMGDVKKKNELLTKTMGDLDRMVTDCNNFVEPKIVTNVIVLLMNGYKQ